MCDVKSFHVRNRLGNEVNIVETKVSSLRVFFNLIVYGVCLKALHFLGHLGDSVG